MGRSCLSQLVVHYDNITQLAQNGQTVGVVYVDCAKTFDQIDFVVISGQGNTDNLVRLIHAFLTRHKQAVQANGARSSAGLAYMAEVAHATGPAL